MNQQHDDVRLALLRKERQPPARETLNAGVSVRLIVKVSVVTVARERGV